VTVPQNVFKQTSTRIDNNAKTSDVSQFY